MVPMPVSLADPNSDAADPDIGTFSDGCWSVAPGRRTGKRWYVGSGTRNKANATFFMHSPFSGRTPSLYSEECSLGIHEVCIELTNVVLNTPLKERGLAGIYQMMKRSSSDCPPAAYAFKNEVSNFAQFLPCALP
jgi:hypothetical protein